VTDLILGHDYLQAHRARIDYGNGEIVSCPPPLKPSQKRGSCHRKNSGKSRRRA